MQELKIPKEEFWNTMKKYALLSKYNCLPDFDQIFHHIKDNSKYVVVIVRPAAASNPLTCR